MRKRVNYAALTAKWFRVSVAGVLRHLILYFNKNVRIKMKAYMGLCKGFLSRLKKTITKTKILKVFGEPAISSKIQLRNSIFLDFVEKWEHKCIKHNSSLVFQCWTLTKTCLPKISIFIRNFTLTERVAYNDFFPA